MTEVASSVMALIACDRKSSDRSNAQRHGLDWTWQKGEQQGQEGYLALQCVLDAVEVLEALGEQVLRGVHDHIVRGRQPAMTGERLPQCLHPSKMTQSQKRKTNG